MTDYRCRVCEKHYVLPGPVGKQVTGKICPPCLEWHHWCGTCRTAQVRSEFYPNTRKPRGLGSQCRTCVSWINMKILTCTKCGTDCVTSGHKVVNGALRKYNKRSKYFCDDCYVDWYHCNKCDTTRPIADFEANRGTGPGTYGYCKPCNREIWLATPKSVRRKPRLKRYGLTPEQYEEMLVEQDHKCAICRRPQMRFSDGTVRELAVDHCHTTGKVRGLLCSGCNQAIGYMDDDPERLVDAAKYLIARG